MAVKQFLKSFEMWMSSKERSNRIRLDEIKDMRFKMQLIAEKCNTYSSRLQAWIKESEESGDIALLKNKGEEDLSKLRGHALSLQVYAEILEEDIEALEESSE